MLLCEYCAALYGAAALGVVGTKTWMFTAPLRRPGGASRGNSVNSSVSNTPLQRPVNAGVSPSRSGSSDRVSSSVHRQPTPILQAGPYTSSQLRMTTDVYYAPSMRRMSDISNDAFQPVMRGYQGDVPASTKLSHSDDTTFFASPHRAPPTPPAAVEYRAPEPAPSINSSSRYEPPQDPVPNKVTEDLYVTVENLQMQVDTLLYRNMMAATQPPTTDANGFPAAGGSPQSPYYAAPIRGGNDATSGGSPRRVSLQGRVLPQDPEVSLLHRRMEGVEEKIAHSEQMVSNYPVAGRDYYGSPSRRSRMEYGDVDSTQNGSTMYGGGHQGGDTNMSVNTNVEGNSSATWHNQQAVMRKQQVQLRIKLLDVIETETEQRVLLEEAEADVAVSTLAKHAAFLRATLDEECRLAELRLQLLEEDVMKTVHERNVGESRRQQYLEEISSNIHGSMAHTAQQLSQPRSNHSTVTNATLLMREAANEAAEVRRQNLSMPYTSPPRQGQGVATTHGTSPYPPQSRTPLQPEYPYAGVNNSYAAAPQPTPLPNRSYTSQAAESRGYNTSYTAAPQPTPLPDRSYQQAPQAPDARRPADNSSYTTDYRPSPIAPNRSMETSKVRFQMTPDQERAAQETEAQISMHLAAESRRRYKRELMNQILGPASY